MTLYGVQGSGTWYVHGSMHTCTSTPLVAGSKPDHHLHPSHVLTLPSFPALQHPAHSSRRLQCNGCNAFNADCGRLHTTGAGSRADLLCPHTPVPICTTQGHCSCNCTTKEPRLCQQGESASLSTAEPTCSKVGRTAHTQAVMAMRPLHTASRVAQHVSGAGWRAAHFEYQRTH